MRITRVELFPLVSQRPVLTPGVLMPPDEGWWGGDQTLVRIHTDEGLSGWSSCGIRGDLAQGSLEAFTPHLTTALEQARFVEYQTHTPYIDGILSTPFKLDVDGMLPVPTKPGLGVEVDLDAIKRHGSR